MGRATRERTGIIRFVGNVVDDTKDLVDDLLDRGRDVDRGELREIRETLTLLTRKIDRLEGALQDTHEDKPRTQVRK